MPELPEVETVRRGLEPALVGRIIAGVEVRRAGLRFPLPEHFAKRLTGARVEALTRRAKYILVELSTGEVLILHLGMTGRVLIEADGGVREPGDFYQDAGRHVAHDHVVLRLSSGTIITYNDVRRFGFMDLAPRSALSDNRHLRDLGIEPLGNSFGPEALRALFADKLAPLKAALLDQRLIAGLGNIYVCEALHRAGLAPDRPAGTIAVAGAPAATARDRLSDAVRDVLSEAIEAGGSTLRDYVHTDGSLGYFQHRFRVYDREGERCPTQACAGQITRMVQSGRSTFHCPVCQT